MYPPCVLCTFDTILHAQLFESPGSSWYSFGFFIYTTVVLYTILYSLHAVFVLFIHTVYVLQAVLKVGTTNPHRNFFCHRSASPNGQVDLQLISSPQGSPRRRSGFPARKTAAKDTVTKRKHFLHKYIKMIQDSLLMLI